MISVATLPDLPRPAAIVRIHDSGGGNVMDFGRRIQGYIDHHSKVTVSGQCLSACTMIVAAPKVCFRDDAELGFHQAYTPADPAHITEDDYDNRSDWATTLMEGFYPDRLKAWIADHGGLTSSMIYLRGKELFSLFRRCK